MSDGERSGKRSVPWLLAISLENVQVLDQRSIGRKTWSGWTLAQTLDAKQNEIKEDCRQETRERQQ
jgi:hypothetical protein